MTLWTTQKISKALMLICANGNNINLYVSHTLKSETIKPEDNFYMSSANRVTLERKGTCSLSLRLRLRSFTAPDSLSGELHVENHIQNELNGRITNKASAHQSVHFLYVVKYVKSNIIIGW